MTGRTHVAVGAAAGLVAASLLGRAGSAPELALAAAGGALGGILPDLDVRDPAHPLRDRISRMVAAVLLVGVVALCVLRGVSGAGAGEGPASWMGIASWADAGRAAAGAVGLVALCCAARLSAHRSFSHSLVALAGFALATWLAFPPAAPALAAGYASHLVLDLLNHRPLRLLWPLRRGVCLGLCRAGGVVDACCLVGGLVMSVGVAAHAAAGTLGALGAAPVL